MPLLLVVAPGLGEWLLLENGCSPSGLPFLARADKEMDPRLELADHAILARELRQLVRRRPHLAGCERGIAYDAQLSLFRWKGSEQMPALTAY